MGVWRFLYRGFHFFMVWDENLAWLVREGKRWGRHCRRCQRLRSRKRKRRQPERIIAELLKK